MGSALRLPICAGLDAFAALDCLRAAGVRTVAAVPRDGSDPDTLDWTGNVAIVLGGEGGGLAEEAVATCSERVTIPWRRASSR